MKGIPAPDNYQKNKLLKLYEILRQENDAENSMTTITSIGRLDQMGISCEHRKMAKAMLVINGEKSTAEMATIM